MTRLTIIAVLFMLSSLSCSTGQLSFGPSVSESFKKQVTVSQFNIPEGAYSAISSDGDIFVCESMDKDYKNYRVKKIKYSDSGISTSTLAENVSPCNKLGFTSKGSFYFITETGQYRQYRKKDCSLEADFSVSEQFSYKGSGYTTYSTVNYRPGTSFVVDYQTHLMLSTVTYNSTVLDHPIQLPDGSVNIGNLENSKVYVITPQATSVKELSSGPSGASSIGAPAAICMENNQAILRSVRLPESGKWAFLTNDSLIITDNEGKCLSNAIYNKEKNEGLFRLKNVQIGIGDFIYISFGRVNFLNDKPDDGLFGLKVFSKQGKMIWESWGGEKAQPKAIITTSDRPCGSFACDSSTMTFVGTDNPAHEMNGRDIFSGKKKWIYYVKHGPVQRYMYSPQLKTIYVFTRESVTVLNIKGEIKYTFELPNNPKEELDTYSLCIPVVLSDGSILLSAYSPNSDEIEKTVYLLDPNGNMLFSYRFNNDYYITLGADDRKHLFIYAGSSGRLKVISLSVN